MGIEGVDNVLTAKTLSSDFHNVVVEVATGGSLAAIALRVSSILQEQFFLVPIRS